MQPHDANQPNDGRSTNDPVAPSPGKLSTASRVVPPVLNSGPTPANLLRCLQRRMIWGLGLGALLAIIAGVTSWFVAPPAKHQVRTLINVPQNVNVWFSTREFVPDLGSHQRNQIALAKSRLVLASALRDPKVNNQSTILNLLDPVEWLEKEVQVDFTVAPDIMRISMRGMQVDELVVLVNAIGDAYLREIIDKQKTLRVQRQNALEELIRRYENDLKVAREAQKGPEGSEAGSDPRVRGAAIGIIQARINRGDTELTLLQSKRRAAIVRVAELKGREQHLGKEQITELEITNAFAGNPMIKAMKTEIEIQEGKLARTIELSAKGNNDPQVRAYRDDIASLQKKINDVKNKLRPDLIAELREINRQRLQAELMTKEAEIISLNETEKLLAQQIKTDGETLNKMATFGDKLAVWKEDITHLEDMTKKLKNEQEAIRVELQAPSRVDVLERGTISRADPMLRKILITTGACIIGFCFALFGVAWLEYRTRRVDSVDEVVLGLGMRLVGTVPDAKHKVRKATGKNVPDPMQQVLTESVDAARTMLLHLARTHSLRTVMVTSAVAGEGKTSLSCHLAASLARAGLRMLLIDGDMRNPTAHRLFGMPCETGFCEVLTDKIALNDAIKATSLRGLYLMPAGHWTDQTALALSQGKPAALFEQLRQQFDLIIVDTSPVLPVADALMIGQQVDGVLLSVLCQVSRLTNLYAAWQRIEQLGVRPLGVVINGVQANLYGSTYNYPYPRKRKAATKPAEKGAR